MLRCEKLAQFAVPAGPLLLQIGDYEFRGGAPFFLCEDHWPLAKHALLPMEEFLLRYYEKLLAEGAND